MQDRAYVLLYYDERIFYPIKRTGFCAGDPQFFGGAINNGESRRDAIDRELQEESDDKLWLVPGKMHWVWKAVVAGSTYSFYVTSNFDYAEGFVGKLNNNEMAEIVKMGVNRYSNIFDLGNWSKEFGDSETSTAFTKAFHKIAALHGAL